MATTDLVENVNYHEEVYMRNEPTYKRHLTLKGIRHYLSQHVNWLLIQRRQ